MNIYDVKKGIYKGYEYIIFQYYSHEFNSTFYGVKILKHNKVLKTQRRIKTNAHAKTWVKGLINKLIKEKN